VDGGALRVVRELILRTVLSYEYSKNTVLPQLSSRSIVLTQSTDSSVTTHQSDPANRARLRWRARRGLLENDLILTRFLDAHEEELTDEDVDALTRLLDLADNPLMDLLLGRAEPEGEVDLPHVRALVARLRQA
jgi:antitoxin CptB